jgi:hypothetical protein
VRILMRHTQSHIVGWQTKPLSAGVNDRATALDDLQARIGQMMMAKARQRARSQAQLRDCPRRMQKQKPAHHLPDILELKIDWTGQAHGALHPLACKMQVPHPVEL